MLYNNDDVWITSFFYLQMNEQLMYDLIDYSATIVITHQCFLVILI